MDLNILKTQNHYINLHGHDQLICFDKP